MGSKSITFPLLCIAIGFGWLLTACGVIPGVNWAWILGLGAVGALVLTFGGINKTTVALGPFLMLSSFFSLLRQTDRLPAAIELPMLVITGGFCLLLTSLLPVPAPKWYVRESATD